MTLRCLFSLLQEQFADIYTTSWHVSACLCQHSEGLWLCACYSSLPTRRDTSALTTSPELLQVDQRAGSRLYLPVTPSAPPKSQLASFSQTSASQNLLPHSKACQMGGTNLNRSTAHPVKQTGMPECCVLQNLPILQLPAPTRVINTELTRNHRRAYFGRDLPAIGYNTPVLHQMDT